MMALPFESKREFEGDMPRRGLPFFVALPALDGSSEAPAFTPLADMSTPRAAFALMSNYFQDNEETVDGLVVAYGGYSNVKGE